ncbi:hypothetical protein FH603_477 [Spirosoma sp. LMG 31447]|uniref:Uncharacterized protein n=1 Tax=Spirosoma utsteinense TaxID=2585773 RepID=A0ABR6W0F8_9BACT|nr:hypothetical protein [Spirosoma utsteinense]
MRWLSHFFQLLTRTCLAGSHQEAVGQRIATATNSG